MSAEAREYLEFALSKIRTHDFYAREADWPSLEQGAYLRASLATDPSEVYPAIRWVLRTLGDGHGYLFPSAALDDVERFFHQTTPVPSTRLGGHVAVLRLPSFGRGAHTRAAHQYVEAAWRALRVTTASCGWVLDLRRDLGGDVFPMLGAVASFLDDGKRIGGLLSVSGYVSWSRVHEGAVLESGTTHGLVVDYGSPPTINSRRVAVLIGPNTMSSGEGTLIALLSQSGVRTFGLPTAGAVGSPKFIAMPDGAQLWVTKSVGVDAMGTPYLGAIAPDVQVGIHAVAEARHWLRSRC